MRNVKILCLMIITSLNMNFVSLILIESNRTYFVVIPIVTKNITKDEFWSNFVALTFASNSHWICMGDLNEVSTQNEKKKVFLFHLGQTYSAILWKMNKLLIWVFLTFLSLETIKGNAYKISNKELTKY